jgi:hypothetical protein
VNKNARHDRLGDHFRREPYPRGAIEDRRFERDRKIVASSAIGRSSLRGRMRTWTRPRRVPVRSRVPANEKARSRFPGAGSKILAMFSMYP